MNPFIISGIIVISYWIERLLEEIEYRRTDEYIEQELRDYTALIKHLADTNSTQVFPQA